MALSQREIDLMADLQDFPDLKKKKEMSPMTKRVMEVVEKMKKYGISDKGLTLLKAEEKIAEIEAKIAGTKSNTP